MDLQRKLSSDRDEKLAAAKRKLKQFQQRRFNVPPYSSNTNDENDPSGYIPDDQDQLQGGHHRQLSSAISGCSTESLAESSKSMDHKLRSSVGSTSTNQRRDASGLTNELKRHSAQGFPFAGGGFYHDEHRSAFQPVKKISEYNDSSANSKLNENYSENDEDYTNKNIIDINNLNRCHVIIPRETDQSDFNAIADTTTRYDIVDSLNSIESNANDDNNSNNNDGSSNNNYSNNDILRTYQLDESRNQNFNDNDDTDNRDIVGAERRLNISDINDKNDKIPLHSASYSTSSGNNDSRSTLISGDKNVTDNMNFDETNSILKQQNEYLQSYCSQLSTNLAELNRHYAQLHAAYTNLVQSGGAVAPLSYSAPSGNDSGSDAGINISSGMELELRNQIQQHLQTMSILVEEKSDLQSQLRQAMEIANAKNAENEELQGRLKANRFRLIELERENELAGSSKQALESSFERQTNELQRLRQESAQLQARLAEIVQDKSELYSRFKSRSREYDELAKKAKELENHVTMKDIYIQQLTGGQMMVSNDDFEKFRRENDHLRAELDDQRRLVEKLRREHDQSRERYESYGQQLNGKILELSAQAEALSADKFELSAKCERLQEELLESRQNAEQASSASILPQSATAAAANESDDEKNLANLANLHKLNEEVKTLEESLHRLAEENANIKITLNEKNNIITQMDEMGQEKDARIRQLEDYLNTLTLTDSNTKSLLEQLHNEKATSARSIAQNLALKNQLIELEDKIVAATTNEMEVTSKLQTAEHAVHQLESQLAEKAEEIGRLTVEHNEQYNNLKGQVNMMLKQDYDRKQLEDRLHHYEVTQKATHDELLKARNQLETLNAENAELRNRLATLDHSQRNSTNWREGSTGNDQGNMVNYDLLMMREEMAQATQRIQQLSAENAELHRIMEQNAADENQNTIHVELRQAVERLTLLSNENEDLRRTVAELLTEKETQNQRESNVLSGNNNVEDELRQKFQQQRQPMIGGNGGGDSSSSRDVGITSSKNFYDDHSSVCSDHFEQKGDAISAEAFDSLKAAMEQLQVRFKRAVTENADLSDQNEQMEHLIVKLQSETETIGEYVTIYRHQRQIMREKMREKDEYVAKLSRENAAIQAKLTELQQLIMHLLKEKGVMQSYPQQKPTHSKPPRSPPSKLPPRPKKLSETVVDETFSGSDRSGQSSPDITKHHLHHAMSIDGSVSPPLEKSSNYELVNLNEPSAVALTHFSTPAAVHSANNSNLLTPSDSDNGIEESSRNDISSAADDILAVTNDIQRQPLFTERSGTAEKILQLLQELQKPDLTKSLPPSERNLHCKYCTGNLIML